MNSSSNSSNNSPRPSGRTSGRAQSVRRGTGPEGAEAVYVCCLAQFVVCRVCCVLMLCCLSLLFVGRGSGGDPIWERRLRIWEEGLIGARRENFAGDCG